MKKRKGRVTAKLIIAPNPILTAVCEPVADGEDVSGIIRDMRYILSQSKYGVGLAASQAGHLKQIIIITDEDGFLVMINPEIHSTSEKKASWPEGCLSYPGIIVPIRRWAGIRVGFHNETSNYHEATFTNMPARIIQHEIDHLDGRCKVGE